LKPEIDLNTIEKVCSYLTGNTVSITKTSR